MSNKMVTLTTAAIAIFTSFPAVAGPLYAVDDADYDAQSLANPFTRFGVATIQWGGPSAAPVSIKGANETILASATVPWAKTTNALAIGKDSRNRNLPLLSYSSNGLLGVAFATNGKTFASSAYVTKYADTLWIRGIISPLGSATSVALVGLQIRLANGTYIDDFEWFLDADANSEYIGYTDPRLASGFSLNYQYGYFNTYGYVPSGALPSFEFRVGKTAATSSAFMDVDAGLDFASSLRQADSEGASFEQADFEQAGFAQTAAVPEPASWALLIGGFGMVGSALRRRRSAFA